MKSIEMICQQCEEKDATVHYSDLYHFCDDCNERYLEEVAKDYLHFKNDNKRLSSH